MRQQRPSCGRRDPPTSDLEASTTNNSAVLAVRKESAWIPSKSQALGELFNLLGISGGGCGGGA